MSLLQPAQCLLTSDSSRSIAFDAGLTWDRSSSEQQGQFTVPDAAMHSVRHLVHTSALHVNSSWNTVHALASLRSTGCSRWPKLD